MEIIIDANESLGDTWREKMEHIYVKCYYAREELIKEGANSESFKMYAGGEIAESLSGYACVHSYVCPPWSKGCHYLSNLNGRWKFYLNTEQEPDTIIMECDTGTYSFKVINLELDSDWKDRNVMKGTLTSEEL